MNYKKLLTGLTVEQFDALAENWYARLNRLKEHHHKVPTLQCMLLIMEMGARLIFISHFYIKVHTPRPKEPGKQYPPGAVGIKNTL